MLREQEAEADQLAEQCTRLDYALKVSNATELLGASDPVTHCQNRAGCNQVGCLHHLLLQAGKVLSCCWHRCCSQPIARGSCLHSQRAWLPAAVRAGDQAADLRGHRANVEAGPCVHGQLYSGGP
jgi:hypothetical protein